MLRIYFRSVSLLITKGVMHKVEVYIKSCKKLKDLDNSILDLLDNICNSLVAIVILMMVRQLLVS
jgi:hypothetical protein